jgi:hypothetical protein
MELINWDWLLTCCSPTFDPTGRSVLNDTRERCEIIVSALDGIAPLNATEVVGWLAEVSTLLVAASDQLLDADPSLSDAFRLLAAECRRAATPFVREPEVAEIAAHPARAAARAVLEDVVTALRALTAA